MQSKSWIRQNLQNLILSRVGTNVPKEEASDRNDQVIPNKGPGHESQRCGTESTRGDCITKLVYDSNQGSCENCIDGGSNEVVSAIVWNFSRALHCL